MVPQADDPIPDPYGDMLSTPNYDIVFQSQQTTEYAMQEHKNCKVK